MPVLLGYVIGAIMYAFAMTTAFPLLILCLVGIVVLVIANVMAL